MRVTTYDPDRQPPPHVEPAAAAVTYTPFAVLAFGAKKELHIDIADKGDSRAVSVRLFKSAGRGRPLVPEHPWHLFPDQLPRMIAALTEAAAAIGVEIPAPGHRVERSIGTVDSVDPVPDSIRGVMEENSRQLDGITKTTSY